MNTQQLSVRQVLKILKIVLRIILILIEALENL